LTGDFAGNFGLVPPALAFVGCCGFVSAPAFGRAVSLCDAVILDAGLKPRSTSEAKAEATAVQLRSKGHTSQKRDVGHPAETRIEVMSAGHVTGYEVHEIAENATLRERPEHIRRHKRGADCSN